MLQFFAILLTVFLLGWIPYASSAQPAEPPTTEQQGQGVDNMSDEGAVNSNSPATGDQLKGEDRADERHSMEPTGAGHPDIKTKDEKSKKELEKEK